MPQRCTIVCSVIAAAAGTGAFPASAADERQLEQVTVQADSLEADLPADLAKSGTRVDVISGVEIKRINVVDVATALQSLAPGLYLSPKNGPFDYVDASLQGSRTGDILWLVDGVRINNRLYNGTTPLDTMPASMVDHIEILEGGQALFYGTQAVAGAVDIVTKGFSSTATADFTIAGDTHDGEHFDGSASNSIGGNQFVVYAAGDKSSGFQPFRDQDYQPSGTDRDREYRNLTLGIKYAYNFSNDLRLSADWQHTDGRLDFAQPFLTAVAYNDRAEDLVTAKLDAAFDERIQLLLKPYYHSWRSHYTEYDNTVPPGGALDVIENDGPWGYRDYGVNALAKLRFGGNFEYFVGYDLQRYSGNDAVLVISQHTENTNAFFGQVRTTTALFPKLSLAAGARYSDPSVGESATVWNISAKYEVAAGIFARGQVGTAFRLPTAEELFANDPNDERGNPDLKPEKSRNANLSVGQKLPLGTMQLEWELIGFYREIDNLIDYTSFDAATNQSAFGNLSATVHMRGAELSLDMAASRWMSAHLDYTYNHTLDPSTGQAVARGPNDLLKVQLDVHPTQGSLELTATATHVGSLIATGLWDGSESYGRYTVVDLSGSYYLGQRARRRITVSVENLSNRTYASRLGTGVRDSDGSNYTYWNLGVPRTLRLSYTYLFH